MVLFLGDSITAGLGLDPEQAFPALIQRRLDESGLRFRVVNGGVSGETSAGGLRRIDWLMRQPVRALVIELGGNDALRGTDLEATRANLQGIIDRARSHAPDLEIVLAGMQVPPNLGSEYTRQFRQIFPTLAEANRTHLIPFLLEGVGGLPQMTCPTVSIPTTAAMPSLPRLFGRCSSRCCGACLYRASGL